MLFSVFLLQPWWQIMPTTLLPFLFKLSMNASMILKTSKLLKIIFFYLKSIENYKQRKYRKVANSSLSQLAAHLEMNEKFDAYVL